eukprot:COSAG02_NODE_1616_length_11659_cov_17.704239_12_plen_156_part_00
MYRRASIPRSWNRQTTGSRDDSRGAAGANACTIGEQQRDSFLPCVVMRSICFSRVDHGGAEELRLCDSAVGAQLSGQVYAASAVFTPTDLSVNGLGAKDLLHTAFEVILLPARSCPLPCTSLPHTVWGSNARAGGRYQKASCFTGLPPQQEGQRH